MRPFVRAARRSTLVMLLPMFIAHIALLSLWPLFAQAKQPFEFRVLATSKTSTMEKELRESTATGYEFVGMTVGKTLVGGEEVVSILRKKAE